jgi:hypothetical protein
LAIDHCFQHFGNVAGRRFDFHDLDQCCGGDDKRLDASRLAFGGGTIGPLADTPRFT